MGLVLVVETNVFLMAEDHAGCGQVVNRACYSEDYMLGLDLTGKIRREYKEKAQQYRESRLAKLLSFIIEREWASHEGSELSDFAGFTLPLKVQLTDEDKIFLHDLHCDKPIEPQMFGIARGQPHTCVILPDEQLVAREPLQRGYRQDGRLAKVRGQFSDLRIVSTDDLGWIDKLGDPPPCDTLALQAFLQDNRQDENCAEREFIELKCPARPENGIPSDHIKGVMEAVCAMTNTTSGYIFIGVEDDGTILGVARKVDGVVMASWDALWRRIASSEVDLFSPRKPILRQWLIPASHDLPGGRRVLALRVHRQRSGPLSYRHEVFYRQGTMSVRRDAVRSARTRR